MKIRLLLLIPALLLTTTLIHAQKTKIGHVDATTVYKKMKEVTEADSIIKIFSESLQAEAQKMQDEYNKKLKEFKDGEAGMDEFIKKNKIDELKSIEERFQKFQVSGQEALIKKQNELYGPINDKFTKALKTIAKKNGYKYILDVKNLLYFDESDDVSKLLEAELGIK